MHFSLILLNNFNSEKKQLRHVDFATHWASECTEEQTICLLAFSKWRKNFVCGKRTTKPENRNSIANNVNKNK